MTKRSTTDMTQQVSGSCGLIDSSVSVTHGSACWLAHVFDANDDTRVKETRVGLIDGARLFDGVDIDKFISEVWKGLIRPSAPDRMTLRLMLWDGLMVLIESLWDSAGVKVIDVQHDSAVFPAGLRGRWVDASAGRQNKLQRELAAG